MSVLSQRSLNNLKGVNQSLVDVVKRAIEITKQDFMVVQGLRTKEQCYENYGKGRTAAECSAKGVPTQYAKPLEKKVTWLRDPLGSKHAKGKAVDLVAYPIDWNTHSKYVAIADAMRQAAKECGVTMTCGIDWKESTDPGHFEV